MAIRHAFVNAKADGADATVVRPSDWNADHVGGGVAGIQHVDPTRPDDTGDGLTWGSAKKTVGAAHDALLNAGSIQGGTINLSPGTHTVPDAGITITRSGTQIIGPGRNACRLLVPAAALFGIKLAGADYVTLRDFKIQTNSNTTNHGGLWVADGAQHYHIENLWIMDFGWGVTDPSASLPLDAGPYALRMNGSGATWSDWGQIHNVHTFRSYRSIVAPGGGINARITNFVARDHVREAVYIRRMPGAGGSIAGAELDFVQGFFVNTSDGDYLIRVESDPANPTHGGNSIWTNCATEPAPGVGTGGHHVFLDSENNMFSQHTFSGGGKTAVTPKGVEYGSLGNNNIIGQYKAVSNGFGVPTVSTGGTGNSVWRPASYHA